MKCFLANPDHIKSCNRARLRITTALSRMSAQQEQIFAKCANSCKRVLENRPSDTKGAYSNIAFLVGAGASTSAGIPDFRSKGGLYECYGHDLFYKQTLELDPEKIYGFCREYFGQQYSPTQAHHIFAALQAAGRLGTIVTQNIDGLSEKAGVDANRVKCLHGSLAHFSCSSPLCSGSVTAEEFAELAETREKTPTCYMCQSALLRPDIVLFGEALDQSVLQQSRAALAQCDLFVCVGTSLQVNPAALLPLENVRRGVPRIWINRDAPPPNYADFFDVCILDDCDDALSFLFPFTDQHSESD